MRRELKNHETGETIDISHIKSEDLSSYLEDRFNMKIYYFRHTLLDGVDSGRAIIDFGSYKWFVYESGTLN